MALLQISEPGCKPAMPAHKLAVGIDLGTTNSLVAASCGGRVEILPDQTGEYLMPSVVQYRKGLIPLVGEKAKAAVITDPENTVVSVKRLLGKTATEIRNSDRVGRYQLDSSKDERAPALLTAAGSRDPVQVSADILSALVSQRSPHFVIKPALRSRVYEIEIEPVGLCKRLRGLWLYEAGARFKAVPRGCADANAVADVNLAKP